jgi:hypothetical protein
MISVLLKDLRRAVDLCQTDADYDDTAGFAGNRSGGVILGRQADREPRAVDSALSRCEDKRLPNEPEHVDRANTMPAIHLIKKRDPKLPPIIPIEPGSRVYRSGHWALAETTAKTLIGGTIYLHEKKADPSFFGGIVTSVEMVGDGEHAGRIVFTFETGAAFKGIAAPSKCWVHEMQIIP